MKLAKKIAILCIGITVLIFGFLLLFIPGPGLPMIFLGLSILSTEIVIARKIMQRIKKTFGNKEKKADE